MKVWDIPLLPLSWVYGAILSLRNLAYDRGWKASQSVGIPVISIGNITVGGTGKTPMAEFLLGKLLEMGHRPAYLSRGYGRQTKGFVWVNPGEGSAERYGDEAFQVATRFPEVPVAVCEDRVEGARQLLARHDLDILVLDDAFQHRRICRDLDLVMVDASRMPTKDRPLPAGRLREPLRGLRRADALLLTKFGNMAAAQAATSELKARFPQAAVAAVSMEPKRLRPFWEGRAAQVGLDALGGRSVIAFSGLGNNRHFETTVQALGVDLKAFFPFPDHHAYSPGDIEKLLAVFEAQTEIKGKLAPALILTTEKDFFRLKALPWMQNHAHLPLYFLEVGMSPVEGWEIVEQKIKNISPKN
ncbi:MAG TPA: tetraacyldisaccharide 4'-kinase [Bacteroidia bacterium]|nr:tetraacyldisaccharide 4'-kinase [Bacteroidia bacterium]